MSDFWDHIGGDNPNSGRGRVVLSANARGPVSGFLVDLLTLPLLPHFIAVVCVICLLLVTSWLWVETRQRFPRLEPGSYAGEIESIFGRQSASTTPFFVESLPSGELYVSVARSGWQPEKITLVSVTDDSDDVRWAHPVVLVGPDAKLRFSGAEKETGFWIGKVKDLASGGGGVWRLYLAKEEARLEGAAERVDVQLWLRLKAELDGVEDAMAVLQARVPAQRQEIEKLTGFITEGDSLRARADQKYRATKAEVDALKEELKQRRAEARDLEKKLVVSQSVTPKGKLVSLARASLDREARWIDSLVRTGAQPVSAELESAIQSSSKILELKDQINQERERIYYLRSKSGGAGVESVPPSFDSIWNR